MDIALILKVAGIGLIVTVLCQVLSKSGRDDHTSFVSIAGILIIFLLLISKLAELITTIENVFGLL